MKGRINEWLNERIKLKNERMNEWIKGWIDEWMNKRMKGWKDEKEWKDERKDS